MRRALLAAAVALGLLAACGPSNLLGGSVGDLFPLTVSRVDVLRNDDAVQVTYYANRDTFLDVVIRLTVSLTGITPKPGTHIQLQGESEPGHQRAAVAHVPGGEPVRLFPNIKQGDFVIGELGDTDRPSSGNFSMSFETTGGDLGQGRSLSGSFSVSKTVDGGFGTLP